MQNQNNWASYLHSLYEELTLFEREAGGQKKEDIFALRKFSCQIFRYAKTWKQCGYL